MFELGVSAHFLSDLVAGIHQPEDDYRLALYMQAEAMQLNKKTRTYNSIGEIPETGGYIRGGQSLTDVRIGFSGPDEFIAFDRAVWRPATMAANGATIYNASKDNKILCIMAFGFTSTINGTFTVSSSVMGADLWGLPPPGGMAVMFRSNLRRQGRVTKGA